MEIDQTRLEAELERVKNTARAENQRAQFAEDVANYLHQQQSAQPTVNYHVVHHGAPPPPPPPPAVPATDPVREAELVRRQVQVELAERTLGQHLAAANKTVEQVVQAAAAKVREADERAQQDAKTAWEAHMAAQQRAAKAEAKLQRAEAELKEKPKEKPDAPKPEKPDAPKPEKAKENKKPEDIPKTRRRAKSSRKPETPPKPSKRQHSPEPQPAAKAKAKTKGVIIEVPIAQPPRKQAKQSRQPKRDKNVLRSLAEPPEREQKRRVIAQADAAFADFAQGRSRSVLGGMDIRDILAAA